MNEARVRYLTARSRIAADSSQASLVRKSMDFERAFVAAGGRSRASAHRQRRSSRSFGDRLRESQLPFWFEAGFTPVEAIKSPPSTAPFLNQTLCGSES
jgi:hypothetical protein